MDLEKKLLVTKKIKLHEMEKGKKKKKTPQDCNSPIYSSSNRRAKTEKYRKRNAGSIPLRP